MKLRGEYFGKDVGEAGGENWGGYDHILSYVFTEVSKIKREKKSCLRSRETALQLSTLKKTWV